MLLSEGREDEGKRSNPQGDERTLGEVPGAGGRIRRNKSVVTGVALVLVVGRSWTPFWAGWSDEDLGPGDATWGYEWQLLVDLKYHP
ncbi:hypothetical protein R1flu_011288 [Riccia fluitans]|uniref:Uncharacterized protein n=1 Tax=Riccia fluitans TaxID=41844 RepID=A0ABD1Z7D3_9MARC